MKKQIISYTSVLPLVFLLFLQVSLSLAGNKPGQFKMPAGLTGSDYLPNTIIFKVDPAYRSFCSLTSTEIPALQEVLQSFGPVSLHKMFPATQPPSAEKNEYGFAYADLSLIYEYEYSRDFPLEKAINSVLSTGVVLYAEPKYLPKPVYTPNDPSTGLQYFLTKIQAYSAWNISKGDSGVVIGITDTGTDPNHPDLAANLKHNYADPVNGVDDDNDTYTDNFSGWDLGENDNDPSVGSCGTCNHGSHVSGCAAAVTDNNTGVASPGFYSKFLPVKIANASGSLTKAYEGITYAADHGCQIINCSWGGSGGGQLGQDVITYASINKNSLVVVAAGNNNNEQDFYPGRYQYAFNVASTDNVDSKSGFSNYGYSVDVCAPGDNIYSTIYNNTYAFESGTSMASPVCAGAAAIVKSFYPAYSGLQVGEQLRQTADNVDNAPGNGTYAGKLGNGRINMYRALTESHPSVRMENMVFTDNNDNTFVINDTVNLAGDIINYLAPTANLVATLSSQSSYITFVDNSTTAGAVGMMGIYNNTADPFKIKIKPNAPLNANIKIRIDFTDGSYTDFQYFYLTVNVDYINVSINDIGTSVTSKGRIGYNTTGQSDGLGFKYMGGSSMMYEGGLMIGNNSNSVSDVVRGDPAGSTDLDFQSAQTVHVVSPTVKSEYDLTGLFNDNLAPLSSRLNVMVNHNFYVWSTAGNTKYVIFEYWIKNNGSSSLGSLYAGIYADFDIGNSAENLAATDQGTRMGYCYNTASGGLYAGIKVLTSGPFLHFATDNDGTNGGISNYDGFTSAEKYTTLSTNHATAGGTGTGNDVSNIVSTGPFALNPGDSVKVAFAFIAGDDLNDLLGSASNAQVKYDAIAGIGDPAGAPGGVWVQSIYPNPAAQEAMLSVYTEKPAVSTIRILDAQGRELWHQEGVSLVSGGNLISLPVQMLANGLYSCLLETGGQTRTGRFAVSK